MRNPSKNTIKKIMRPKDNNGPGWGLRNSNYFVHNEIGARLYIMSKGKICNLEPKSHERYLINKFI